MTNQRSAQTTIWVFAFGYFAFYVPYSAAVKATSKTLWPGMDAPLTRLEILPGFFLGAAAVVLLFMTVAGWWRFVPRREILGRSVFCPRPLAILSGVGTVGIIAATTLAYTFHGISIVFALLLMRGGVLIMAPIVDALFKRQVAWNSWLGLMLSLAAVTLALADQNSYVLSLAAILNLAVYYTGYIIRLQCITGIAKSEDPQRKFRFFAEEQTTSMALLLLGCLGLTVYGATVLKADHASTGAALLAMFSIPTLMIGVLYGYLFLFGSMIYMDARENSFCIPINRCSSVMAGLVATTGMVYLFDQPPVTGTQLVAAGIIMLAITALAQPRLLRWWQQRTAQSAARLLLFVCDGNVSRSPIAAAICRSEFAKHLNAIKLVPGDAPFEIESAGLRATPNQPMAPHAVSALKTLDVDPGSHAATNISAAMVERAAVIFCMSDRQKSDLIADFPQAAGKVHILDQEADIGNPAGKSLDDYLACATQIRASVLRLVDRIGAAGVRDFALAPVASAPEKA